METENLENDLEGEKFFVKCVLCGDKMEVDKYESEVEVLYTGWYEITVTDKSFEPVRYGYICNKCFEKYFV